MGEAGQLGLLTKRALPPGVTILKPYFTLIGKDLKELGGRRPRLMPGTPFGLIKDHLAMRASYN